MILDDPGGSRSQPERVNGAVLVISRASPCPGGLRGEDLYNIQFSKPFSPLSQSLGERLTGLRWDRRDWSLLY